MNGVNKSEQIFIPADRLFLPEPPFFPRSQLPALSLALSPSAMTLVEDEIDATPWMATYRKQQRLHLKRKCSIKQLSHRLTVDKGEAATKSGVMNLRGRPVSLPRQNVTI